MALNNLTAMIFVVNIALKLIFVRTFHTFDIRIACRADKHGILPVRKTCIRYGRNIALERAAAAAYRLAEFSEHPPSLAVGYHRSWDSAGSYRRFTLKQRQNPGKVWIEGPSGRDRK